jgi:DNA-binding protein YbaB
LLAGELTAVVSCVPVLRWVVLVDDEVLSRDLRERLARLGEVREQAERVTAWAWSGDGLVGVQVGAHGQLREVRLDPGVFERLPPQRLAVLLVELARAAAADAVGQARDIMAAVLPAGGMAGLVGEAAGLRGGAGGAGGLYFPAGA